MVSITAYGGANEIGGNKFLIEDKDAEIYLDFGQSFGFGEEYFYEYLKPRTANGLEAYFEFNLVPKVRKLYGARHLKFTDLKYEKPDVDAIFISHSHSDHFNHIQFVDEEIPIYLGHGTHKIIQAYRKLYPSLYYDLRNHKNVNHFKSGDAIKVKHLTIEPIHVEHSIPGAYGFIIHTSKGPLAYTGDFRLHGPKKGMSEEFTRKAVESRPYALMCEGTRMGSESEHNYSEEEVEEKVNGIVKGAPGLVLASFSMSNVDRFMSFYHAAIKNKRKLVVDTKFAYILDMLQDKVPVLPDIRTDEHMQVYYRIEGEGKFDRMDYDVWERDYFHRMVTYKELAEAPGEYIMHTGFYKFMEFVYIQPRGADFIYSMSEHFLEGEENAGQKEVMDKWIDHFQMKFHTAHCSGHASRLDIAELVSKVKPKRLIPIHTQDAKNFLELHKDVVMLENGKKTEI